MEMAMSLWRRITSSPEVEQSMKQYYDEKGLAYIRAYFAPWIEERIMSENLSNGRSESYEQITIQFCEDLKHKLILVSNNDPILKFKFAEIYTSLKHTPAAVLYMHLRNGIHKEIELLKHMPQNSYMYSAAGSAPTATVTGANVGSGIGVGSDIGGGVGFGVGGVGYGVGGVGGVGAIGGSVGILSFNPIVPPMGIPVGDEFYGTSTRLQKLNNDLCAMHQCIKLFTSDFQTLQTYVSEFNQTRPTMNAQAAEESDKQLHEEFRNLLSRKSSLVLDLRRTVSEYQAIQTTVMGELQNWQRNQASAGNGAQFRDNLDSIQRCVEMLVDTVTTIQSYLTELSRMPSDDNVFRSLLEEVRLARQNLVVSAFIVEKQPPQVMKTNTRFAAAVRWLIGSKLDIYKGSPSVECIILSEAQAQRHFTQRNMSEVPNGAPASSGEIMNNFCNMEYQPQTYSLSANFRNMQLKKIKRAEKKGTESVMDEKFALFFFTTVVVNEFRIHVWALSLPVVVIVHGNQEPQSWATITWDNAFSEIVREPFQVPERVSWQQLSCALHMKFNSATGRGLTQENLNFLYEKLCRNDGMGGDHKDYITWAQFCKEPLPDRSFTFWEWFFAIMKVTKDHLLGLWKAGLIVGFINKRRTTEEILRSGRAGTFLLRFSDSELGGITIAFLNEDNNVMMLSPWTTKDLNIRGLADRVHDLTVLLYVSPSYMAKDEAFGEFYTQRIEEQTRRDGYVINTIRAHVPAIEDASVRATPQHQMQSPHPQDIQSPHPQDMQITSDHFNITDFDSNFFESTL